MDQAEVVESHTYRGPNSPEVIEALDHLRELALMFSLGVVDLVPDGPERNKALERIREASMWAREGVLGDQPAPVIHSGPTIEEARISEAEAQAIRDGKARALDEL